MADFRAKSAKQLARRRSIFHEIPPWAQNYYINDKQGVMYPQQVSTISTTAASFGFSSGTEHFASSSEHSTYYC